MLIRPVTPTTLFVAAGVAAALLLWQRAPVEGQARGNTQVPIYEFDPSFPRPMNETWAIGPIGGMAVDRQDHLFVVQRPGGLVNTERFGGANDNPPKATCCIPAPPVLEFDSAGT